MRINRSVTVITINYNRLDDLKRTVESVLSQQFAGTVQYVVVDGGSTDGSVDFLESLDVSRSGLRFSYVSAPDDGIADAMNTGLALTTEPWIIYMNGGDTFRQPHSLSELMTNVAAPSDGRRFYYSSIRVIDSAGRFVRFWHPPAYSERRLFLRNYIPHQTVIFPARSLRALGGFDQSVRIALDYELWLKAALMGMSGERHDHCEVDFLDGGVSSRWQDMLREERRIRLKWTLKRPAARLYDAVYTAARYVKNRRKNHA